MAKWEETGNGKFKMAASNFKYAYLNCLQDINEYPTAIPVFSGSVNTTGIVRLLNDVNVSGKSQMVALTGITCFSACIYDTVEISKACYRGSATDRHFDLICPTKLEAENPTWRPLNGKYSNLKSHSDRSIPVVLSDPENIGWNFVPVLFTN